MIRLSLPLPPSGNARLTISNRSRTLVKTKKYRAWQDAAVLQIKSQLKQQNISEPIYSALTSIIKIIAPNKRRRDYDNVAKCVNDALQKGGAIGDDSMIQCAFSHKTVDRENGGIVLIYLFSFDDPAISMASVLMADAIESERRNGESILGVSK